MSQVGIKRYSYYTPQSPRTTKGAQIAEIKMEIAKVKQQEQTGVISKEEAQMQIAMLEAKLEKLESGFQNDTKGEAVVSAGDVNFNQNVQQVNNTDASTNENPNENNDSEQKKASQDAYFDQQALYNRAFHHI